MFPYSYLANKSILLQALSFLNISAVLREEILYERQSLMKSILAPLLFRKMLHSISLRSSDLRVAINDRIDSLEDGWSWTQPKSLSLRASR